MKFRKGFATLGILFFSIAFLMGACKSDDSEGPRSGAEERGDLCELLNEDLVRETFGISPNIVFEKENEDILCSYGWTEEDTNIFYSISLNFATGGQRDAAAAQAVWESQNEGVYKDKDMQEVSGVGDRATWSTLGGGQLRVLADGYIFYVSLWAYPGDSENGMSTAEMIEKSSIIANAIIDDL